MISSVVLDLINRWSDQMLKYNSNSSIQEGISILMATHDPMIEEYAHIVYELGDGQVIAIRKPNP